MLSPTQNFAPPALTTFSKPFDAQIDWALIHMDARGRVLGWSPKAAALFQYTSVEMIGMPFTHLCVREEGQPETWPQHLQHALSKGGACIQAWHLRKDGAVFRGETLLNAARDLPRSSSSAFAVTALIRDLSAAEEHEQTLRRNEHCARLLVEGVRDYAIFSLDPEGFVTSWNEGARLIKGYEAQEIIGKHFSQFYPPDAIERRWPDYELRVATTEGRFEDEGWRLRKDGTRFWANVIITSLRDERGTLLGFSKITRDLSARHRQSEALRQSEERFRLLVDGLADYAIVILDSSGLVSAWNLGAERIFGYRAEEIMWKHVSNLYRPDEVAASLPWHELKAAREHGSLENEAWRHDKAGKPFWAKVRITALVDDEGQPYGYAHITHDMTQQLYYRGLEQIVRRMGEFAGTAGEELQRAATEIGKVVQALERHETSDASLQPLQCLLAREHAVMTHITSELVALPRIAENAGR